MATVMEVLERLSRAKDRQQLSMAWQAYARHNAGNEAVLNTLDGLKRITNIWNSGSPRGKTKVWR